MKKLKENRVKETQENTTEKMKNSMKKVQLNMKVFEVETFFCSRDEAQISQPFRVKQNCSVCIQRGKSKAKKRTKSVSHMTISF